MFYEVGGGGIHHLHRLGRLIRIPTSLAYQLSDKVLNKNLMGDNSFCMLRVH